MKKTIPSINNGDPTDQILPQTPLRRCFDCKANLPLSAYGSNRRSEDGYNISCKACRSQYNRLRNQRIFQSTPHKEDPIIRSLRAHNQSVLSHMANNMPLTNKLAIYGYDVSEFKVVKGSFTRYPTQFHLSVPGSFEVYTNPDVAAFINMGVEALAFRGIRLELSPQHLTYSALELYGKTL